MKKLNLFIILCLFIQLGLTPVFSAGNQQYKTAIQSYKVANEILKDLQINKLEEKLQLMEEGLIASVNNSNEDKEEVQKHWDDSGLKDALHLLTLEPEKLQWDVYEKIDEILQKLTTKHYILATVRLIATLQPRLFSMTVNPKSLDDIVANFKQDGIDFDYEGYERVSSKDEVLETLRRSHLIQTFLIQEYQDDFIYDLGDVTGALANLNKN